MGSNVGPLRCLHVCELCAENFPLRVKTFRWREIAHPPIAGWGVPAVLVGDSVVETMCLTGLLIWDGEVSVAAYSR